MINTITAPCTENKKKVYKQFEGRGFQYKGIALHLRKQGTLWIISLFNSGMLTRGHGKTIEAALMRFDIEEGSIINGWLYERGGSGLQSLKNMAIESNAEQIIDLEYSNGRLVTGQQIKAGDLI